MQSITQKDNYGCGAACTAFVLRKSYEEARSLFKNGRYKARKFGFFCKEIVDALKKRNKNYRYCYIKSQNRKIIYKEGIIVFISRSKKYPAGHFLSRDAKHGWMDPWINFPSNLKDARSGFRKRLPGRPIYAILPLN